MGECPPEIGEEISGKLRATDPVELQGSLKRVPFSKSRVVLPRKVQYQALALVRIFALELEYLSWVC